MFVQLTLNSSPPAAVFIAIDNIAYFTIHGRETLIYMKHGDSAPLIVQQSTLAVAAAIVKAQIAEVSQ